MGRGNLSDLLQRILGPLVLGISPSELLAHLRISDPPKIREVLRHLNRTVRWREEVNSRGHPKAPDAWRFHESKEILDARLKAW
jgi:hypothetical protein